jgi:hypothetical protein
MSKEYNGWTNYETWNFNLWIRNEEEDYKYSLELASDSEDVHELSKKLKEWACFMGDDVLTSHEYTHGFIKDMVNSSIKEVNFYEVAEHLWEERENKLEQNSK